MLNKVTLIGNLGQDPDSRTMPNGDPVCNVRIATSERWKDKQTGEKKESTEWHRITFYRGLAGVVGQYLKKGAKIYVEGRLHTRKWQDKEGRDNYTTEIIASEMIMLGSRDGGGDSGNSYNQSAPEQGNQPPPSSPAPAPASGGQDNFDDDIPF